jgi:glycerol-3-phosphate acyltransferase PlsY
MLFVSREGMMQVLWQMPAMMLGLGYVLGSIPFGLLLTRFAGAGDIRAIGSGNIGATNVLRTGRKGLAATTLLLDLAKGATAVCIARWVSPDDAVIAGAAAVMGHLYPIWLWFKGGKGVATLMGVALALDWRIGAIYAVVWITVLALARISSLGGMLAALSVPIVAALLGRSELVPIGAALTLLVLWRHRDNIGRLLRGTETKIGGKGAAPSDPV